MDLKEQRYVCTLAQYGSITKAAEHLYISQPSLSVYISNLEKSIGTKLFNRIGKRFVLTFAGEQYVKVANQMLALEDGFQAALSDIVQGEAGRLRIGLHLRRSPYLIPAVLSEFCQIHPNVQIDLHESDFKTLSNLLLEGRLDLLMSNRRISNSEEIQYVHVYDDRLLMVARSGHPMAQSGVWKIKGDNHQWVNLKSFEDETFIVQSPEQSIRYFTDCAIEYSNARPKKYIMVSNIETANQMAAEGLGIAFNMESYSKHFHYKKPVHFFLVGDPEFKTEFSVAYCKKAYLSNYMKDFIRIVKSRGQHLLF